MTLHWSAQYIGMPWTAEGNHCWGFARRVWRERFGMDVPELYQVSGDAPLAARHALARGKVGWDEVTLPVEGDAVLMAKGQWPCHVGVWVAPAPAAGILHAIERSGVIFTPLNRLAALGYRVTGYYRRAA